MVGAGSDAPFPRSLGHSFEYFDALPVLITFTLGDAAEAADGASANSLNAARVNTRSAD